MRTFPEAGHTWLSQIQSRLSQIQKQDTLGCPKYKSRTHLAIPNTKAGHTWLSQIQKQAVSNTKAGHTWLSQIQKQDTHLAVPNMLFVQSLKLGDDTSQGCSDYMNYWGYGYIHMVNQDPWNFSQYAHKNLINVSLFFQWLFLCLHQIS